MDTKGKMMITCKEATFLISKDQQDKLSFLERFRLNLHLMMCKYCRRFKVQVRFISKAIGRMKKRVDDQGIELSLSEEQKQILRDKLRNAQK